MPSERTTSRAWVKVAAASMVLAIEAAARAHSGGHGPPIEGFGPGGGRLAAIVLAADAEAGAMASVRGVAEWFVKGSEVEVRFWDASRARELTVPGPAELKWIAIGGSLKEPVVARSAIEVPAPRVLWKPEARVLQAGTIELILPGFGASGEKHVLAISLAR